MPELQLTKEQLQQIESLLAALAKDEVRRERFRADPRTVLGEHGLSNLIPTDVELQVEVEEPVSEARLPPGGGGPTHLDLAHIDSHFDVDPLPPGHMDWSHVDGTMLVAGSIRVTPVLGVKVTPITPSD
jgi:hypothetical protein